MAESEFEITTTPAVPGTVVTSMLILQSDGHLTRPFAEYRIHFDKLVATGLPIVLYLDRSLTGERFPSNVTVIPISIQDLPLWHETRGVEIHLPNVRNPQKDTADYLVITNSKTELIRRTISMDLPFHHHLFLDFGLFHIVGDTVRAQERLRRLAHRPSDELVIPGCWTEQSDVLDLINWRFCGGVLLGPTEVMASFADLHQQSVRDLLPTMSWEVNIWAWMEIHRGFRGHWFQADHNDTILDFPHLR